MKRKLNIPLLIFTIIDIILVFIFMINARMLNVLPLKYVILILICFLLLHLIATLLQKKKKKIFKIIGYTIFVLLIIFYSIGIYYTSVTLKFMKTSFNNIKNTYENTYIVITNTNYNEIYDLSNKKIGYYKSIPNINLSIDKLKSIIEYNDISYNNVIDMFEDISKNKIDAVLIEKSIYDGMKENINTISFDKYKELYTFTITIDEDINVDAIGDVVNIYISGLDFTNTNSDFNMIVTINRNTKKVLLTSIPRDYYMYMPTLGMSDSLEFASVWGINTNKEGLANLFDINVDYTLQIYTKSLVGLVDSVGGVEFCSDISFRTTHALVLDTYDDTKGKKLYVEKGCKTYNGIEILTIARERLAFPSGDRQRQKNCQQIMINIFNKMLHFESVLNYVEILDNLSDLYSTNIPNKLITGIIQDFINGNKWSIDTQSVDGKSMTAKIHAGTVYGYAMNPTLETVETAKNKIKELSN